MASSPDAIYSSDLYLSWSTAPASDVTFATTLTTVLSAAVSTAGTGAVGNTTIPTFCRAIMNCSATAGDVVLFGPRGVIESITLQPGAVAVCRASKILASGTTTFGGVSKTTTIAPFTVFF